MSTRASNDELRVTISHAFIFNTNVGILTSTEAMSDFSDKVEAARVKFFASS